MKAGEYLKGALNAGLKKGEIVKGEDLLNKDKPLLFYYDPSIMMILNTNQRAYLSDSKQSDITEKLLMDNQKALEDPDTINNALADELRSMLGYRLEVPIFNPKCMTLSIESRVFDEQANMLMEYHTKGIKFGTPLPNHGYGVAYTPSGHKRYYGVAVPLPTLNKDDKIYYLEIIETWHINLEEIFSDLNAHQETTFTRKITVPIKPTINKETSNCEVFWDAEKAEILSRSKKKDMSIMATNLNKMLRPSNFRMFNEGHTDYLEPLNYLNTKTKITVADMSAVDENCIVLGCTSVPSLLMDPYVGIFDRFQGDEQDIVKSFEDALNQRNLQMSKSLRGLAQIVLGDEATNTYYAAVTGTHTHYKNWTKELDHNGQGCNLVSFRNLIKGNGEPRYYALANIRTNHTSRYDFEERLPQFGLVYTK